jgi:predicted TIM-barrel fold metal-dependent hydrolase
VDVFDPPGGIVDAHTHVFPPEVVRDRAAYAARDPWFALLYADPRARLITADDLLNHMVSSGVVQSVLCGFPWRDGGLCHSHNDYLADAAATSDHRLAWLATVPPHLGEPAAAEAERCLDRGASGLGELNADAQAFDLTQPASLASVVAVCIARDRPILLHASEPVGHLYPGKGTATPDRLLTFLSAFPELRVVLAHWGGGLPFYELMPEVAAITDRVLYDSAASTYLFQPRVFRAVLDIVGADRVLFGSDHPVLRQDRFLNRILATADLWSEEASSVLGGTARAIYRLEAPAAKGDSS